MRMLDIITKKRDGLSLSKEEIDFFVKGYVNGTIPDYQASALCMAIVFQGMDDEETSYLTLSMMNSGQLIDLSKIKGIKTDKHSTGGVGDKTSLVVGPLVAACGVKVAKMSGRGLGHTGGTLDKMESVPGTNVYNTEEHFINQVNEIGIAIQGQTASIDPADKKLYSLRDVTGTVQSIPLIVSSIMSKKLAAGTDAILLDTKFGSGAFMKTLEDAKTLATKMVEIGKRLGRDTRAVITDMQQPLGKAVGNSLEVIEAINTLKGNGPDDLVALALDSGAIMLEQAKIASSYEEGERMIQNAIDNGSGFKKLVELFKAQGGDYSYIENPDKFEKSKYALEVKANKSGYVKNINCLTIGESAMKLGAGRENMDDVIDMSAGIILNKKVGDFVNPNEVLAICHTNKENVNEILNDVQNAFELVKEKVEKHKIVYDYIK